MKFSAGEFSFVAMSDRQPSLQHDRADCLVGDWVLASSVPEWKTDRYVQFFKPSSHVRTVLFRSGSVPNDDSDNEWVFRGSYFIDPAGDPITIWRRES